MGVYSDDARGHQIVVRTSVTLRAEGEKRTSLVFTHFDVMRALSEYTHATNWKLFVKSQSDQVPVGLIV